MKNSGGHRRKQSRSRRSKVLLVPQKFAVKNIWQLTFSTNNSIQHIAIHEIRCQFCLERYATKQKKFDLRHVTSPILFYFYNGHLCL